jgi:hypothetical protein
MLDLLDLIKLVSNPPPTLRFLLSVERVLVERVFLRLRDELAVDSVVTDVDC